MKKRPTIDDVALKAGVSRQTVSRAINGMAGISVATREQVMAVVAELGYRPSRLAKGMAGSRSYTIGMIVTDVLNPAHANVVRGLQDTAQKNDFNVFLRNTDADASKELEALNSLVAENVDGIVVVGVRLEEEKLCSFADKRLPIVVVHREINAPHISSILTDVFRATRTATDYLFGIGHQRIGLITRYGDPKNSNHIQGYKDAYRAHGIKPEKAWICQCPRTLNGGYEAAHRLITESPELTALITYNDLMAIGAMKACRELDRPVPESMAIFGYDDIALSSFVSPTLSTIRFNGYNVGCVAMRRLLEMISQPDASFPTTLLDIELVIRESTSTF